VGFDIVPTTVDCEFDRRESFIIHYQLQYSLCQQYQQDIHMTVLLPPFQACNSTIQNILFGH